MAGKELTWDDAKKIGIALSRQHSEIDPENLALQEIHRLATLLAEFKGNPADFDEKKLEAIRSAWNMEFLDRTQ